MDPVWETQPESGGLFGSAELRKNGKNREESASLMGRSWKIPLFNRNIPMFDGTISYKWEISHYPVGISGISLRVDELVVLFFFPRPKMITGNSILVTSFHID
jgi:hypothetical protein